MLVVNSAIGCIKFSSQLSSNKRLILSGLTFSNLVTTNLHRSDVFSLVYPACAWPAPLQTSTFCNAMLVLLKPFKSWLLSPTINVCVHSALTCHVCRCSYTIRSSGVGLGGTRAHGEPPLAIPLMIFMTTQEKSNWGSKWTMDWFSCRTSPLDLTRSSGELILSDCPTAILARFS